MTHTLIDGVERNAAHPDTFDIPTADERQNIKAGTYVKVGFDKAGGGGERLWVLVGGPLNDGTGNYVGLLANTPFFLDGLAWGDRVTFRPEHVLDIDTREETP